MDLIFLRKQSFNELAMGESEPLALEWPGSSTQARGYVSDGLPNHGIASMVL
jgi:hypothetical protein